MGGRGLIRAVVVTGAAAALLAGGARMANAQGMMGKRPAAAQPGARGVPGWSGGGTQGGVWERPVVVGIGRPGPEKVPDLSGEAPKHDCVVEQRQIDEFNAMVVQAQAVISQMRAWANYYSALAQYAAGTDREELLSSARQAAQSADGLSASVTQKSAELRQRWYTNCLDRESE